MLKTIQIIALLQGFFLLTVLINRQKEYKKINFWLLVGTVVSVMLYALGDDNYNLFFNNTNWFAFHVVLLVTFFFLLIKYHQSKAEKFNTKDLVYFVPYLVYVGSQIIETTFELSHSFIIKIPVILVAFVILWYLISTTKNTLKSGTDRWMLYFIIPYTIIYIIDRFADVILDEQDSVPFLESYGVIGLSAFLFYIILYHMIISPKAIIEKSDTAKYKSSTLKKEDVETIQQKLTTLFKVDKIFTNPKLTVNDVAKQLEIPRQHLSEVLNVHMKTSFQDLLNTYRVEEFITCLQQDEYKNYSLLGIANEVGFNSKTSFYTTFKKLKGMTPSAFKKTLG